MDDVQTATVVEEQNAGQVEIEVRLREKLQAEYQTRLESEILKISQKLQEENQVVIKTALEEYRKAMTPPTEKDVQKLLDQEYVEFKIKLRLPIKNGPNEDSDSKYQEKTFVIAELPQRVEKRIFKKIKDILVPFSSELGALTFNMLEGDAAKKVVQLMNTFEPVLNVLGSIAAICLNPYEDDEDITEEYVVENISSTRIVKIIMAQLEANHMRDFSSLLFQGSKLLK
jgi:hypothetical protein